MSSDGYILNVHCHKSLT